MAALSPALLGCGYGPEGTEGDCLAEVSFDSTTYVQADGLAAAPSRGDTRRLGQGGLLGCDGEVLHKVDVFAMQGVDPRIAIVAEYPSGIVVAEELERAQWPNKINCRERIAFESATYRPDHRLAPAPPPHARERAGRGKVMDCYGNPVNLTAVYAVDGVDTSIAIAVVGPPPLAGIYVARGVKRAQWPDKVKASRS